MKKRAESFVDFKVIKRDVGILQILDRYGMTEALSKGGNGDRLSGACPLHGGTDRTHFRASVSKNCWNCFGECRRGGNILDFVARKEGVAIREAALLIREWFPGDPHQCCAAQPAPQPMEACRPRKCKLGVMAKPMRNELLPFELKHLDKGHPYLRNRGLSEETVSTFELGYCNKGLLKGHIAIPIHNSEGGLVGYAGRWVGDPSNGIPKYRLPAGFQKALEVFNIHRAFQEVSDGPLVLVEGFFDCMALWQRGVRRVVALMGSSMSPKQETVLLSGLSAKDRILVMFDEDNAGRAGRDDVAKRLSSFVYLKVFRFQREGLQPDQLSMEEVAIACS